MNHLKALNDVLIGISSLPDMNHLLNRLNHILHRHGTQQWNEIQIERRRAQELNTGQCDILLKSAMDITDQEEKPNHITHVIGRNAMDPHPHFMGHLFGCHGQFVHKRCLLTLHVNDVHRDMNTS